MLKIVLTTIFLTSQILSFGQTFEGLVLNKDSGQPIYGADVFFVDLKTGTTTDQNGEFTIDHFNQKNIHVQIFYLGFETIDEIIKFEDGETKVFYLEPSHFELKEVIVTASTGRLQRENIVSVEHLNINELQLAKSLTLAEAISNIPGVEQNTTGAGIGKPVIRGLSGNRIVTYDQGIRVENQQWGDEHGLGIGEIGIESVEVIKGPASLLYGADALGGVLYFVDERYSKHNTLEANFESTFLSNTQALVNHLGLKAHKDAIKFNLFAAHARHADYLTPGENRVKNTRFDEKNIKTALGFNKANWISNLRYSYLQNNFGITEDAEYLTEINRTFEIPFQRIGHHSLSLENKFFFGDASLSSTIGYSSNDRKEFEDDLDDAALAMRLNTLSYNIKWNSATIANRHSLTIGSQGMHQRNTNSGEEILVPDAIIDDIGLFSMVNSNLGKLKMQAGLRYDRRRLEIPTIFTFDIFKETYTGLSYSLGGVYNAGKSTLRANVSSGFRAPNTSELFSDGVHEGTTRYEIGNYQLKSEKARQFDISYDYSDEHLGFSINPFYSHIENYIYLSPRGDFIDDNPVFQFLQTDANLKGMEVGIHYHPHGIHWLHIESNLSTIIAQDADKNNLPLIPATKLMTTCSAEFSSKSKWKISRVYLQHIGKFSQNNFGQFETMTPAYSLYNIGLDLDIENGNNTVNISTGIKNLLNKQYIDHLSRFKTLGIANPGLNFYISASISLNRKLGEK